MSKWFYWWTPDGKCYRSPFIGMTIPKTVSDRFSPADERYSCRSHTDLESEKFVPISAVVDWELEQESVLANTSGNEP
jgi:hypothetical protein